MQNVRADRDETGRLWDIFGFGRWPWYGVAVLGVACLTIAIGLVQPHVAASHLQTSYLLLVLVLAILGGQGPALLAALLAFLAYDWFFVLPFASFIASDPEEWLSLGLLLTVGLSTGQLAARLKDHAMVARQRTREALTLYELTTTLLADACLEQILSDVVERLTAILLLPATVIRLRGPDGRLFIAACSGRSPTLLQQIEQDTPPEPGLAALQPVRPRTVPGGGTAGGGLWGLDSPISLDGLLLGMVTAYSTAERQPFSELALRLVPAFASQTALAMGRLRLSEEQERARVAEEANRLKSILLASVSHDLRTPLTTIRTSAAYLRSEVRRHAWAEAAANIEGESERLNHLVDNLLELSRLEFGVTSLQRTPEEATELVGAVARRITPILDGRTLRLSAPEEPLIVLVDGPKLIRVLVNLLDNAIKFSPAGSEIEISLRRNEGKAVLRVYNHGPAIPVEEQERIFDKFQRVQRVGHRETTGTGLGLAISKGFVEAHDGAIWTRNEASGVAFYVALPLAGIDEAAAMGVSTG